MFLKTKRTTTKAIHADQDEPWGVTVVQFLE